MSFTFILSSSNLIDSVSGKFANYLNTSKETPIYCQIGSVVYKSPILLSNIVE